MNGAAPRHMACKTCRDRKVRCGGEQPACDKCTRTGETCVYLATQNPSKAELVLQVEALQKRLDEAEAYIRTLQDKHIPSASLTSTSPGVDALFIESNPPQSPSTALTAATQPCPEPFSVMDDIHMHMDTSALSLFPADTFGPPSVSEEAGAALLEPVAAFSSAVFRNQAVTSVMASVAADYIKWLRQSPSTADSPVFLGMLDTIEARLRELCDEGRASSQSALRELVAALEILAPLGGTMAAKLGSLEASIQREAQEEADAFRARYNPCVHLSEQLRRLS